MKIALVGIIKPQAGTGDGMAEYTYQLYSRLKKTDKVDLVYTLEKSKRNDIVGLLYTRFALSEKVKRLADKGYDIINVTNQEAGFVVGVLRNMKTEAKIITTIHDLMRVNVRRSDSYHPGVLQSTYSASVGTYINLAMSESDAVLFLANSVERDALRLFPEIKSYKTILEAPKDEFSKSPLPKKKHGGPLTVGYVGALAVRKNVMYVLKTARLLQDQAGDYKFLIYGSGPDKERLMEYKEKHNLQNVHFMGFAPEDKLMKIYDSFDLFFYPSLEEGSSLPILDAQTRGLPVIANSKGMIDKEVTKYCFMANSEEEAAKTIKRLRQKGYDPKMKSAATKYVRSFSWDNIAKETRAFFESVKSE